MQIVINTFGASLHKTGELFEIRIGDRKVRVSAHKTQSILICTAAHLSTDAIQLALQHHIDIVFLDRAGSPFGRLWNCKMGSTAAIRRQQLRVAGSEKALAWVRNWVAAKLLNQRKFLKELARRRPSRAELFAKPIRAIGAHRRRILDLQGDLDSQRSTIMALEGAAGRAYFGVLSRLMPSGLSFKGRSRQPAKDEFNAALNYAYGVLYSIVDRACVIAGLDPFLGLLHTDNYQKRSLVFDLIEPFRIIAEKTVVHLFTSQRLRKEGFEPWQSGISLSQEGKAVLIDALNTELARTLRWPVTGSFLSPVEGKRKARNIKQKDAIQMEAHALANRLVGKIGPPPVQLRTFDPDFEDNLAKRGAGEE